MTRDSRSKGARGEKITNISTIPTTQTGGRSSQKKLDTLLVKKSLRVSCEFTDVNVNVKDFPVINRN